ncbi:MAG: rod shape-determining protein RodA [Longimicrobiales bacterium]
MGFTQRIRSMFGDPVLFGTVLALTLFGVVMIYSAGQLEVPDRSVVGVWKAQIMFLVVSLVALLFVMRIPVRWLEWIAVPAYVLSLVLLLTTLVVGQGAGTALSSKSWIALGPVKIQPAQFANVATVLMLGKIMGSWRETPESVWKLWKPVIVTLVPMALVLKQPDLGTALVFGGVLLATIFWAGTPLGILFMLLSPMIGLALGYMPPWIYSVYMIGLIVFLWAYRVRRSEMVLVLVLNLVTGTIGWPLWDSLKPYQQARLTSFVNPEIDKKGTGYHVSQSKISIGSGQIIGQGYLHGPQKRLRFLPEQHTDFIYSVVGEEFGLVGAGAVLIAYLVIMWRLAKLAERLSDPFGGIVVFGILGAWFTHVIVNVGMTLGVMPVTGIPLPFISYGGSFLLATYIALGVAQRVAMEQGRI